MTNTQKHILASARHCFEAHDIHQTRMDDIAAHAKLSRQTLYKYFISKQDIIDHIALEDMTKINETLRNSLNAADSFADRLTEIIIVTVEIALPNPYIRAILKDVGHMLGFPARNPRLYQWQVDRWRRLLNHARDKGELAKDIDLDLAIRWITMCQLLLIIVYPKLAATGVSLRPLIQRFIVYPLLHNYDLATDPLAVHETALAAENATLRALIAAQALEIFQLQQKYAPLERENERA